MDIMYDIIYEMFPSSLLEERVDTSCDFNIGLSERP